jgi:hypothetical protein
MGIDPLHPKVNGSQQFDAVSQTLPFHIPRATPGHAVLK